MEKKEIKKRGFKAFVVLAIFLIFFGMIAGFVIGIASRLALLEVFLSLAPTSPIFPRSNILVLGVEQTRVNLLTRCETVTRPQVEGKATRI